MNSAFIAADAGAAGDLCEALNSPHSDLARELYVRRRIWWLSNDRSRVYASGKRATMPPLTLRAKERKNMLRMVELHEQADSGIVERAELLRQLGRFDDAVQVLAAAPQDNISERGDKIMGWALAKDPELKMLSPNGY